MSDDNDCTLFVQLINNHFASYCSKKTLDTGTVNYLPTVCKNTWLQQKKAHFPEKSGVNITDQNYVPVNGDSSVPYG